MRYAIAWDHIDINSRAEEHGELRKLARDPQVLIKIGGRTLAPRPDGKIPTGVRAYQVSDACGLDVFLDRKFFGHKDDVLAEIAGYLKTWERIKMVTIAPLNEDETIREASAMCADHGAKLIVVTILTTIEEPECRDKTGTVVQEAVLRLARNAKKQGAHGIVCSGRELRTLRHPIGEPPILDENFMSVIPAIREEGDPSAGQARIMTFSAALHNGANVVVLGTTAWGHPEGPIGRLRECKELCAQYAEEMRSPLPSA